MHRKRKSREERKEKRKRQETDGVLMAELEQVLLGLKNKKSIKRAHITGDSKGGSPLPALSALGETKLGANDCRTCRRVSTLTWRTKHYINFEPLQTKNSVTQRLLTAENF